MNPIFSRRELILRGAFAGAALTLPGVDALAGVRERRPRPSVHCLPEADKFSPEGVLADCSFASFAPDGDRIALTTVRGIELYDRPTQTRVALTPPGFTIAGDAWHPDGSVFIASGPAADGSGPFLHSVDPVAGTVTRLLPDHPDQARAACFSPDGRKVAFTYRNRYVHQLAMADWVDGALRAPVNLVPFVPQTEASLASFQAGLAWYETRGFSADGRRLYFASDRRAGMLNVNVHYLKLPRGSRHKVTYDHGVVEGAVIPPDDATLYFAGTRARETGYMTMFTGPFLPPLLGCVAEPTLHRSLAERHLAPIGNGDVLAVDEQYGLGARMIGKRSKLVAQLGTTIAESLHRTITCSMSPDGRQLAVAVLSAAGSNVILLGRRRRAVPRPVAVRSTPTPRGAVPLSADPIPDLDRTVDSEFGGRAHVQITGTLDEGRFQASFEGFNPEGTKVFQGDLDFETGGGGFRHSADVVRLNYDETEEKNTFYRAGMRVDWAGLTDGSIESRSRSGSLSAAWNGATFANVAPWRAGAKRPDPIRGARRCTRKKRR